MADKSVSLYSVDYAKDGEMRIKYAFESNKRIEENAKNMIFELKKELERLNAEGTAEAAAAATTVTKLISEQEKKIAELAKTDSATMLNTSKARFENEFKTWNVFQRNEFAIKKKNAASQQKDALAARKRENVLSLQYIKGEIAAKQAALKTAVTGSAEETKLKAEIAELTTQQTQQEAIGAKISEDYTKASKDHQNALAETLTYSKAISAQERATLSAQERYTASVNKAKDIRAQMAKIKADIAQNQELGLNTDGLQNLLNQLSNELDDVNINVKADKKDAAKEQAIEANKDNEMAQFFNAYFSKDPDQREQAKENLREQREQKQAEALQDAVNDMADSMASFTNAIDTSISAMYENQAHIEARLQGSGKSFTDSLKNVTKNVAISGVVSQKAVIENIKKLSDLGVAYNLDYRAFLGTMSDSIANTFDAFDKSLLRMIRLQQADTTAARLGMEASLTKLFNEYFSDTSYLSEAFDNVASAIQNASSLMARDASTAFEYVVQKWLGALYSVGLSDNAVSTIAEGINLLGTGDVSALSSNDTTKTLFAMAASQAGLDFGEILVEGLNPETTNKLLASMVEYLRSIATNTENNQVTKSAFSNIFGMNIADLRAISNLSESDIQNISNESASYNNMMQELDSQFGQVLKRTHITQLLSTAFDNAMTTASVAIGSNIATYGTWMVLNVIEDLTGGINLPHVAVMGNTVDLSAFTVTGLAKMGMAGLGLMGSLLGSLFSGSLFGTMDGNKWGWDEYTSRGGGPSFITKGASSGLSESSEMSMTGSASSDDVKSTSMEDGTSSSEEDSKTTNASVEGNSDVYEEIRDALMSEDTTAVLELAEIHKLLEKDRVFMSQMDGMDMVTKLLGGNRVFMVAMVGAVTGATIASVGGSFTLTNSSNSALMSQIESNANALTQLSSSTEQAKIESSITTSTNSAVSQSTTTNVQGNLGSSATLGSNADKGIVSLQDTIYEAVRLALDELLQTVNIASGSVKVTVENASSFVSGSSMM